MRLANAEHEARSWVIADIADDFDLLDAWALPAEGRPDEFDAFLEVMAALDPTEADPISRVLFWVRMRLGDVLGWDRTDESRRIPGSTDTRLRDRLPAQLRDSAEGTPISAALQREAGFVPLYRTDDEWAAEISNATVHGVLHLGWFEVEPGLCRAELAIYVKRRGRLGEAYMLLIAPFRHLLVYPALLRQIGRAWDARSTTAHTT